MERGGAQGPGLNLQSLLSQYGLFPGCLLSVMQVLGRRAAQTAWGKQSREVTIKEKPFSFGKSSGAKLAHVALTWISCLLLLAVVVDNFILIGHLDILVLHIVAVKRERAVLVLFLHGSCGPRRGEGGVGHTEVGWKATMALKQGTGPGLEQEQAGELRQMAKRALNKHTAGLREQDKGEGI